MVARRSWAGFLRAKSIFMEYKFRGKRKDNKKWIYGSFVTGGIFGGPKADCYIFTDGRFFEVEPESVGVFIDRKDKYRIEIFEGDILLSHAQDGKELLTVVTWNHCNSKFEGSPIVGNGIWMDKGVYREAGLFSLFAIIGNIHDNPELLTPSQKGDVSHTMEPNTKQPDELKQAENAQESASQDQAMEVDSEEGSIEG